MLITAPQLIRQSFSIYRRDWKALTPYMTLLFVPTLIMSLSGTVGIFLTSLLPVSDFLVNTIIILLSIAAWLFSFLVTLSVTTALKHFIETGSAPHWREVLKSVTPHLSSSIWVSILVGLLVLLGTILLFIPAIIFSGWYAFSVYMVLFEGKKGTEAMRASKELVAGRWLAVFWRIIAPGFVYGFLIGIVSLIVTLPFASLGASTDGTTTVSLASFSLAALQTLLSGAVTAILTPLATLPLLLLYKDAKEHPLEAMPPAAMNK
jgi:hypothetical protein